MAIKILCLGPFSVFWRPSLIATRPGFPQWRALAETLRFITVRVFASMAGFDFGMTVSCALSLLFVLALVKGSFSRYCHIPFLI